MYQPPTHWEAALAFILITGIACVGYAAYCTRVKSHETVCFQFQTVQQMQQNRGRQ
jgi:hypothetical protein